MQVSLCGKNYLDDKMRTGPYLKSSGVPDGTSSRFSSRFHSQNEWIYTNLHQTTYPNILTAVSSVHDFQLSITRILVHEHVPELRFFW